MFKRRHRITNHLPLRITNLYLLAKQVDEETKDTLAWSLALGILVVSVLVLHVVAIWPVH